MSTRKKESACGHCGEAVAYNKASRKWQHVGSGGIRCEPLPTPARIATPTTMRLEFREVPARIKTSGVVKVYSESIPLEGGHICASMTMTIGNLLGTIQTHQAHAARVALAREENTL